MLLVRQNAARLFAGEINNCLLRKTNTRCISLKLSRLPRKPDDWSSRTIEAAETCLGTEGLIFIFDDDDVAILTRNANQNNFTVLVERLGSQFGVSLQGAALLLELPLDGEIVAALPGHKELPEAVTVERTQDIRTELNHNLVRTIRLRREKRTAPQILIVEDDGFFQRLLSNLLVRNFKLTMARTGVDAVDLYIQCAPDVVLLNIGLPDINGFEVLARIMALDPYAYVTMLSSQASRENVIRSTELGAKGFIGKPFTSEKLLSCVSKSPFVQEKRMHALTHGGMIVRSRSALEPEEHRR